MKKIKYCSLKEHWLYTVKEASKLLGVHVATIRTWIRQGLKPVPNTKSPILIKGKVLKSYLKERQIKRKCKLADNQFYCLRCHQITYSKPANVRAEILEEVLTTGNRKALIYGICEAYGSVLHLFSSERIVQKWLDQGWVFQENVTLRYSDNNPSGNLHSQCDTKTTLKEVSNV